MESSALETPKITLAFIGSPATGKTRMVLQSVGKTDVDSPAMFVRVEKHIVVDESPAICILCDTQDGNDYKDLRERVCRVADVIFLCFSVIQPQTLEMVESRWKSELAPLNKPIILIGTKTDQRENEELCERLRAKHLTPVTREQGQRVSETIGALAFYEISCEETDPLDAVFKEALNLVFGAPKSAGKGKMGKRKNENCLLQ